MSFQDVAEEEGRWRRMRSEKGESEELAVGVFKINTAVSSFYRLVNSLGTPKDTLQLRQNLHKTRLHIGQLVKDTSAKLKQATQDDHHSLITPAKKIADAKLAKDFQSVLREFQKAQRIAAERESAYAPYVPKQSNPIYSYEHEHKQEDISSSSINPHQTLLLESKREEVLLLDDEIVFNEAIIEEREQGIQEIQQQISQVNEIFKDLAVLVHDQGLVIDDIASNIANSHAATAQATTQLAKASKLQKSGSSLTCLLLLIFGIILLIVIIVVVA